MFIRNASGTLVLLSIAAASYAYADDRQELFEKAVTDFRSARIAASVEAFDRLAKLSPGIMPQLWQRGIALYYGGRYDTCRAQFEAHTTVNPNDVENAAWHFLCVARASSLAEARRALLPVGPDGRAPMREIYRLFRGELTSEKVEQAAGDDLHAQFYAHLYIGLYLEASGDRAGALGHIRKAAAERYAGAGYMHEVARVHVLLAQHESQGRRR